VQQRQPLVEEPDLAADMLGKHLDAIAICLGERRHHSDDLRPVARGHRLAANAGEGDEVVAVVATLTVLEEWEAAAERDPGHFETWIYLTRLRQEAGRTQPALESALRARVIAATDRERAWAASELGTVQQAAGYLAGARASYTESHEIRQRLAADNTSSAQARRDASASLIKLGDVQLTANDLVGARASYAESLQIARRLAADNPGSAVARRDMVVSLGKLALIPDSGVRWKDPYQAMQAMKDDGILVPSDERLLTAFKRLADAEQ